MELKQIQNKTEWENFVSTQQNTSVLQSWLWGDFLQGEGQTTVRFFVIESGQVIAAALVAKVLVPGKMSYLYCPRGPVFKSGLSAEKQARAVEFLASQTAKHTAFNGAIFFRFDAALPDGSVNLHGRGFRKANKESQPRDTIIVDLAASEEDLLKQMKPKTRYNIRLAEKKGVHVLQGKSEADIEKFYELLKKTTERNEFSGHGKKYYLDMWRKLSPDNLKVYLAESEGKIIAGLILTTYANDAIYLHGASDYEHRNLMAPFLLQWKAMQDAKRNNCRTYDFWGVAPEGAAEDHPWSGITRFKDGFGGQRYKYTGTYDFVYSQPKYSLFNFIRALRRRLP